MSLQNIPLTGVKSLEWLEKRLAKRLETQAGGRGKIIRESLRNFARLGWVRLPSGFGKRMYIAA